MNIENGKAANSDDFGPSQEVAYTLSADDITDEMGAGCRWSSTPPATPPPRTVATREPSAPETAGCCPTSWYRPSAVRGDRPVPGCRPALSGQQKSPHTWAGRRGRRSALRPLPPAAWPEAMSLAPCPPRNPRGRNTRNEAQRSPASQGEAQPGRGVGAAGPAGHVLERTGAPGLWKRRRPPSPPSRVRPNQGLHSPPEEVQPGTGPGPPWRNPRASLVPGPGWRREGPGGTPCDRNLQIGQGCPGRRGKARSAALAGTFPRHRTVPKPTGTNPGTGVCLSLFHFPNQRRGSDLYEKE